MNGLSYPIPSEPNLGETFVNDKTQGMARALLASADALGLDPISVVATRGGFLVPNAVYDHMTSQQATTVAGEF